MKVKKMMATIIAGLCVIGSINFTTKYSDYKISVVNAEENIKEDEEIHIWDGTDDTSWYDESDSEFHIYTPEEFAGIATLSAKGKNFKDKTVYIENDLYFNKADVTSFGDSKYENILSPIRTFDGTFDGQNHFFFGVSSYCLFDHSAGTIKNLNVVNSLCKICGICYLSSGQIINCYFNGRIDYLGKFDDYKHINRYYAVAGICYKGNLISECVFNGTIRINSSAGNCSTYGICYTAVKIEKCFSYGRINNNGDAAGICYSASSIENSANHMNIEGENEDNYVHPSYIENRGSIASQGLSIINCYNTGKCYAGGGLVGTIFYSGLRGILNSYTSNSGINRGIAYTVDSYPGGLPLLKEENKAYYPSSSVSAIEKTSNLNSNSSKELNDIFIATSNKNLTSKAFAEKLGDAFLYVQNDYPILKCELDNSRLRLKTSSLKLTDFNKPVQLELRETTKKPVTWISSNPDIATVDENGIVKAVGYGYAVIYALYDDKQAICDVTSYPYTIEETNISMNVDDKYSLTINANGNSIDPDVCTFSSSDTSVATVENGWIQAVSVGTSTITVNIEDAEFTCEVTVNPKGVATTTAPPSPTIDKPTVSIKSGEKSEIKIMNYNGDITWLSSDSKIATVTKGKNNTATIEGIAAGSAKIYAMISGGKNLTCEVEVSENGESVIKYGDANCDGTVDLSDAVIIMQSISNPSKFGEKGTDKTHITTQGQINGDVSGNKDGLTNKDALAIQKYMLQLITTLPE